MSTVDAPAPPRTTTVVPAVAPWWRRSAPWVLLAAGTLGGIPLQTQLSTAQERVVGTVFMFVALATAWNLIGGVPRAPRGGPGRLFCPGGPGPRACLRAPPPSRVLVPRPSG